MSEKDETTFALNQDDTGTKTVFETPWFSVEKIPTVLPGKDVVEPYYRIVQPDTVTGIVLTEDQQLVVVKQFRPAVGSLTIELPAGEAFEHAFHFSLKGWRLIRSHAPPTPITVNRGKKH